MKRKNTSGTLSKKCGIIIPVYNSDAHLGELLIGLNEIQEELPLYEFSVAIVDDGSNPPVAKQSTRGLAADWIRHSQNVGKGAAIKSGFSLLLAKDADPIITMDGDLQHPPEFIPEFLQKYESNKFDVIIGSRKRNPKIMPIHRIISNTVTSLIISAWIGQWVPDSQCGFRLYSREVVKNVQPRENRFHLESEMIIRCGWRNYKIGSVPIPTIYNQAPSAIRNVSDTLNFITLIFKLVKERMIGNV